MADLTHFNAQGEAHMVDVGDKEKTKRCAIASGVITMSELAFSAVAQGKHKKGDVLGIARIAAIMGAKQTPQLIPLCHPIALTRITVEFELDEANFCIQCRARTETNERTGVEMEALTAVNVALLTIYDMCKAADKNMQINQVHLVHKSGGKSGDYNVTG